MVTGEPKVPVTEPAVRMGKLSGTLNDAPAELEFEIEAPLVMVAAPVATNWSKFPAVVEFNVRIQFELRPKVTAPVILRVPGKEPLMDKELLKVTKLAASVLPALVVTAPL